MYNNANPIKVIYTGIYLSSIKQNLTFPKASPFILAPQKKYRLTACQCPHTVYIEARNGQVYLPAPIYTRYIEPYSRVPVKAIAGTKYTNRCHLRKERRRFACVYRHVISAKITSIAPSCRIVCRLGNDCSLNVSEFSGRWWCWLFMSIDIRFALYSYI